LLKTEMYPYGTCRFEVCYVPRNVAPAAAFGYVYKRVYLIIYDGNIIVNKH